VLRLPSGVRGIVVPHGDRGPTRGSVTSRRVVGFGSAALLVVAGVTLLAQDGGGLYWWPAAIVVAFLGALFDAWVLLVEILR
jgi:modulator of FtsH protease